jgi:hypothetical protein
MAGRRKRAARFIHTRAAGMRAALAGIAAADPIAEGWAHDAPAASDATATPPADELESGIAEVFAALHAAAGRDDDTPAARPDDEDAEADPAGAEAVTFRLLGELDRLWQRAA